MKKLILIILTLLAINPVIAACPKPTPKKAAISTTKNDSSKRTPIVHDDEEDDEELSVFGPAPKPNPIKKWAKKTLYKFLMGCENFASKFRSR